MRDDSQSSAAWYKSRARAINIWQALLARRHFENHLSELIDGTMTMFGEVRRRAACSLKCVCTARGIVFVRAWS